MTKIMESVDKFNIPRLKALLWAEGIGLLPDREAALLEEAKKRSLLPDWAAGPSDPKRPTGFRAMYQRYASALRKWWGLVASPRR